MIVLVINCGSSSLKYQVFDMTSETCLADGLAERVSINGGSEAVLKHRPANAEAYISELAMPDHTTAMTYVLDAITHPEHGVINSLQDITAIGHRVVHGGEKFSRSVLVTDEVIKAIEDCSDLAPLHNPANLMGLHACAKALPDVPQIAVFDTAFHQTMPAQAYLYGLPYEYYEERGIRRYGFHGTSHRYVAQIAAGWLEQEKGIAPENQCIVTCHIGNGGSMAAVKGGKSVDTTMGLTPLEGLLMGTRCGDMDPAIVGFLMSEMHLSPADVDRILNKNSGLLGISGISSDMRDVTAAAAAIPPNKRAQMAIEVFCYRITKYTGAYAAAMGGIDALIFTAGIGENVSLIRQMSCANLGFLGLEIDLQLNEKIDKSQSVINISAAGTRASVLVIPTNEELMIARDTKEIL